LKKTAEYARSKGLYVILDAKRGDIGATSEAYSAAYLRGDVYDCLTVNPYLGIDGIQPFIDDCEKFDKSIFVLVKTSNKSSGDFQDIIVEGGKSLYMKVAEKVLEWGNPENIGVVIGATYPEQLREMRKIMPNTFFLVPGFGAQGGAADDVKPAFDENGEGAIVNSSRAIMCAWVNQNDGENFGKYAREEVIRMRDAIMGTVK
ncbi:MAG: orotidine-5'-phosphate decarboxylase, partial [Oscillospiraceae bacterium]|nr:orotidine-5'-phosphate decarboxylase [Oscillospiraceae bacterium]